ncbi:Rne/Rng family ribonuclease [Cellulomonas sp. KRMCY2]|uniref:Rne/Rng family ribonuclease n=1 Tax=Cellulomonas sp. KRMCY2 TaxID=1304865 RepID=UPI0004BCF32E|nr:Rne/Rng family ribonuclease [Cellulomonas sp. KRMCY2]
MTNEHTPTDQNSPGADERSAEAAPAARRTRARRVATSPATTPTAAVEPTTAVVARAVTEPSSPIATSSDPTTGPERTEQTDQPDQPRSRSRRATSSGKRTPQAGPTTDVVDAAPVVAPTEPVAPVAAEAAPSRARRSRRATSSGAATAATEQSEALAVVTPMPEPAEPAEPAAGATGRPTRKRATRSAGKGTTVSPDSDAAPVEAAATEAAPVDDAPADAAPARTGRSRRTSRAAAPTDGLDVIAELGGERPAATRTEGDAPRLATTALLFQAPDPANRPKRRRAQAPAGPPKHIDEITGEEILDEDEIAALDAAAAVSAEADQAVDADLMGDETDDGEDEGAPRRRRRRGGRGRRGRSGTGEQGEQGEDEGADDEGVEVEAPAPSRRSRRGGGSPGPDRSAVPTGTGGDEAGEPEEDEESDETDEGGEPTGSSSRRRRRRRRGSRGDSSGGEEQAAPAASTRTRSRSGRTASDEVTALKGSTRLEAKRQRRREGRDAGRRRTIVTESEFLARRESVERSMVVRESGGRVQIAVLEDGVLVEHFVSRSAQNAQSSMAGNVYLGRVQNVLPSMEAAFVDVGKGRNAVLYAGEVNWDAAGLEGQPRRIEQALKSGDSVLVQVTKDPIGHKGARLTSQITLAGRYLVYVPAGGMTGISRKLPENERARLKKLLKEIVPDAAGVIVRTAAEGASEDELRNDVQRLQDQWAAIEKKAKSASAPALLQGEPDLAIRVVRDIFNDDFSSLVVQGDDAWSMISEYVGAMAPDLAAKVSRWTGQGDVFGAHRIDEQLAKGMDRKVYLPSGGSLVIDRTEAMTVVDVNTGKFTGSGGTLEETVTRNNLEAAEEIVRQLRLRDIGGIIVIDFIDMVLESNRDLVLRRLVECLGRDRTKHQVAEVTSLGLVQMTRKRVGQGLVEAFSETCQHCNGRGFIVHSEPIEAKGFEQEAGHLAADVEPEGEPKRSRRKKASSVSAPVTVPVLPEAREAVKATLATIAAAAAHAHDHGHEADHGYENDQESTPVPLGSDEGPQTDVVVVEQSAGTSPVDIPPAADHELAEVEPSDVSVGDHDGSPADEGRDAPSD